jgi:hypothetical protein
MKVKVSEATGAVLDWMVAVVEDESVRVADGLVRFALSQFTNDYDLYVPSVDWAQGGPIIERTGFSPEPVLDANCVVIGWTCRNWRGDGEEFFGSTPLIVAMRCYVASKLGDEVQVPDELCS